MNCCYNETFSWPFILDHSTFLLSTTTAVSSYAHSYVIQKSHGNYGLKPRVSKYSWHIFKLILIIRLSERSYTAYSILFKSGAQVGQRRHQSRLSNCLIMAYLFSSTMRYLIFFFLYAPVELFPSLIFLQLMSCRSYHPARYVQELWHIGCYSGITSSEQVFYLAQR